MQRRPAEPAAEHSPSGFPPSGATRAAPSGRALAIGLLLAPAAWIFETNAAQTIAAHACFASDKPTTAPMSVASLTWIMSLVVVSLLLAIAGLVTALRNWKQTATFANTVATGREIDRHAGAVCFLARVGTISSALFTLGVVASALALIIVSPCRGWSP